MLLDNGLLVIGRMLELYTSHLPVILGYATIFTLAALFHSQASSPGKVWWRNPGLGTDVTYLLVHTIIGSYFRIPAMLLFVFLLSGTMSKPEINDYFANGRGPLSTLPFWVQVVFYVLVADFLLYWIHRIFHRSALWPVHAIHHSAKQVDWTTAFRFHPLNSMMQHSLVTVLMIVLGIKPEVIILVAPIDSAIGYWQHSNSKWTLGPLKYVIATPVFHRWHHTLPSEGGDSNFAPTFAFYDWMFGTYYMPEGQLPENFGVDDAELTEGYLPQLLYPFRAFYRAYYGPEAAAGGSTTPRSEPTT